MTSSSGTAVAGTTREPIAHPDAPPLAPLLTTRPRPRTGVRADVLNDMAEGAEPQRLEEKINSHNSYSELPLAVKQACPDVLYIVLK